MKKDLTWNPVYQQTAKYITILQSTHKITEHMGKGNLFQILNETCFIHSEYNLPALPASLNKVNQNAQLYENVHVTQHGLSWV